VSAFNHKGSYGASVCVAPWRAAVHCCHSPRWLTARAPRCPAAPLPLHIATGSISERYAAAGLDRLPFLSKLESLASSAVRAAGKVQADLIVVYTATGALRGGRGRACSSGACCWLGRKAGSANRRHPVPPHPRCSTAGRTAQLVAKYRPPMPILTLVVPRLMNDGIRWRLEGR
jgi:hypothetical protein